MAVRAAVCAVSTLSAWLTEPTQPIASQALYGLALLSGSWDLARHVARDLRALRFNTEFLMLLVVVGSTVLGTWSEGALLLVLFSSSSALGAFASVRTHREIQAFLKGVPKQARRLLPREALRPESAALVARLRSDGLRTVMLTGDRAAAAECLAREVGVDEVLHQLKPEERVAAVHALREKGCRVAMMGDRVNDAPVIAGADVGVAMGTRGSDAALEQADVVLMNDRLENFLFARDLSRRARRVIGQNLVISMGTMAFMALATLGWSGLPLWSGVAAHEGSTVLVVLNSLRLLASPKTRLDRTLGC